MVRPTTRSPRAPGPPSWRRSTWGAWTSTPSMADPGTWVASPERIVSTSGSSGTGVELRVGPQDLVVGGLGGLLLGPLLARAGAGAPPLAREHEGGGVVPGVIGALALDRVAGGLDPQGGGELLDPGLVIGAHPELGGAGEGGGDEPHDELPGRGQAVAEVDGAKDRLEGVGQDRILLPPARGLLPLAQEDIVAE